MNTFPLSAIGNKDLRQLAAKASSAGWTIELTRGNHVRWVSPTKEQIFTTSLTPGSNAALWKARTLLKRGGLDARR